MRLLAIDPGPEHSAYVLMAGSKLAMFGKVTNQELLYIITCQDRESAEYATAAEHCVIEKIASFGMPVGAEVFETVYWTGRFAQAFGADRCERITRIEVKTHLCHSSRAKDGNVRQALIDRFGPVGTKRAKGLLYGISGDCWSALAVAVTWMDKQGAVIHIKAVEA